MLHRKTRKRIYGLSAKRKTNMENSIYTGLSLQVALQAKMDLIANNIANVNTPGYRGQNMVFTEYVAKTDNGERPKDNLSMVMDYGQYQNTQPGPLQSTGNPLDVALQGPGWFGVQTPEGTMYTRAGNFQINNNGELVTGSGHLVAGDGGGSIVIPPDAKEIKISKDGTLSTDQGQIGRIGVYEFTSDQDLEAAGNGLYKASQKAPGAAAQNTQVLQGMLEGSNVQPVLEMTRMIDVLRSYQNTQRILQNEHDRERAMIERMSRTG